MIAGEQAADKALSQQIDEAGEAAAYSDLIYQNLQKKILFGGATLAEVRQALTDNNPASLTNTVHALFAMRWHRGVYRMLYDMWESKHEKYPEINWNGIEKEPVKIALASTLNRVQISDTAEFQNYIRQFEQHEHEFVRAQVVIALGFNGDPEDIDYIKSMLVSDNDYVSQSAITSLGLMGNNEARDLLIELGGQYKGTDRGAIINGILRDAYNKIPVEELQKQETEPTTFYD